MEAHQTATPEANPLPKRILRITVWVAGIAVVLVVLNLLGVPVRDWIHKLLKNVRSVPAGAIVGGVVLETVQTVLRRCRG